MAVKSPPKLATRLLKWFCRRELFEEIEGDISEEYYELLQTKGKRYAGFYYYRQVISFIKPFAIKKKVKKDNTMLGLFKNYLMVSVRAVGRDKLNFAISSVGLCVAIISATLIYLVTDFETTYDAFHSKADRIFRINYDGRMDPARNYILPTVGPPLGPAIKSEYPEVIDAVRIRTTRSTVMNTEDGSRAFYEENVIYADPSLLTIFDFPLQKGDPSTALAQPNNIILTENLAKKYFGDEDPMNEILMYDGEPFRVTGVFDPIPANNHFPFDAVLPFEAFKVPYGYPVTLDDWGWISFYVYILMDKSADYKTLEEKLPAFAASHFEGDRSSKMRYRVQPLKDIYFGNVREERIASGNYTYVIILYSVGVLLLILAGFNFTNLSVAKAISRGKETGLRKTLGTSTTALWFRYLSEPVLTSMTGTIMAILIVPFLLPFITEMFEFNLNPGMSYWTRIAPFILVMGIGIGILAGIYPSLLMVRYKPAVILKGALVKSKTGSSIRKALVTFQFIVTSFLIIGSFIISGQIRFLHEKDLGFDKDKILLIKMPSGISNNSYRQLRNSLLEENEIASVSVGGGRMDAEEGNVPIYFEGRSEPVNLSIASMREEFFSTIGTPMVSGREFSFDHPSDTLDAVIINEEAAKVFGWSPSEAIGKHIRVFDLAQGKIIGVVKNYNSTSLHKKISPLVLTYPRTHLRDLYLRISGADKDRVVASVQRRFSEFFPGTPFDYVFMSNNLKTLYKSDVQFEKLVNIFSLITILISVLGLYGLLSLVSQQRIKEVTVRKILGANFKSLIITLSSSFVSLILSANLISWPISYIIANQWINSFAYRIDISWMFFGASLLITLLVSGLILIYQASKVALLDPVETLRYE